MSDAVLVNPQEYDVDLHDVYAGFMGYFERKGIPWYKSSYSAYFTSFNEFLSFGWSAIVVTDKRTGKGHVTVKGGSGTTSSGATTNGYSSGGAVGQFARMIKTRFGESLPKLPSQLPIEPYETKPRIQRLINDLGSYKRLAATIPAAQVHALKKKVRNGDIKECAALWGSRNHTFLALEVTWWEKGNGVILEAGMCGCRCRNIDAMHAWPPIPDDNYRRSHYVVSEWLDKRTNTHHHMPAQPRTFAHGESQVVSMSMLEKILNASISSLASPENDLGPNTLVILACGDSSRLSDLKTVHIPNNVLIVDVGNLERALYRASQQQQPMQPSRSSSPLPLRDVLHHLDIAVSPHIPLTNSGNAAFYLMTAFQLLVDRHAEIPAILRQPLPAQVYPQPQIYPSAAPMTFPRTQQQKRSSVMPVGMRRAQTMYWEDGQPVQVVETPPQGQGSGGDSTRQGSGGDSRGVSSDGTLSLEKMALG